MIVGTAGHIDHGKTALVRALTGVDTDRLKEEKARGISIELGYAFMPRSDGEILGFIDVPGHERLIHTMVAGVGGIDVGLLVVAADDGVMPQTREHLNILSLLGIPQGAVAVTKVDRVDAARLVQVHQQLDALLAATPLRLAPRFALIATDAGNEGVSRLRNWLMTRATAASARTAAGRFRLAIDRIFTLKGRGTIVTGTVRAGRVGVGERLVVMPAGHSVRVRSIHTQNRESETSRAGERCALNLAGIEKQALSRGDWLAHPDVLTPSLRLDSRICWLGECDGRAAGANALHIHWGTADQIARVERLAEAPDGDGHFLAQLVFKAPVCAAPGDAFIVRDAQAARTIGGGIVLDPSAPARHRSSAARLAYLAATHVALKGAGIAPLLRASPFGMPLSALERLLDGTAERALMHADARIVTTQTGSFVFANDCWHALLDQVRERVRVFHVDHPDEPGIGRGRLRRMACPTMSEVLWREVVEELLRRQALVLTGPWLRLAEHRITLSSGDQRLADQLKAAIAGGRFEPKWVRDLAATVGSSEQDVRRALLRQAADGAVYQIVRDLFYDAAAVRELRHALHIVEKRDGVVQVAQYRDIVGVGRKRAVQILEFFDRVGHTRRKGDSRNVREDSHWVESA